MESQELERLLSLTPILVFTSPRLYVSTSSAAVVEAIVIIAAVAGAVVVVVVILPANPQSCFATPPLLPSLLSNGVSFVSKR